MVEEKGLMPEQTYNADETGLMWKCLAQRTLVSSHEKYVPGFNKPKDKAISIVHITVSLIFIFSIIRTLNYPDYLLKSQ